MMLRHFRGSHLTFRRWSPASTLSRSSFSTRKKLLHRDWTLPSSLQSTTMGRNLDFFEFTTTGEYERKQLTLHNVLESYSLQARDLLSLERQNVATIQPRNSALVLSLSHVRAVVSRDSVLVFNPSRPAVLDFAQGLSEYLTVCHTMNNPDQQTEESPSLPFELCVLEGILSSVSQKYQRRINLFEPVINDVLRNMRKQGGPGHATEQIQTLLPLRNSLSRFERSNDNVVKCLERLLNSDEAMSLMSLSARYEADCQGTDQAQAIDLNLHHDVELVVESYFRRFEDFYAESFALRKNIEATQDTLELALDEYRNRLITINVHAAMATVGLAVSTTVAGFFGSKFIRGTNSFLPHLTLSLLCLSLSFLLIHASRPLSLCSFALVNLYSGLEEVNTYPLFWMVVGGATFSGITIYATAIRQATRGAASSSLKDLNEIVTLGQTTPGQHDEYDMQDILLSYLDTHGGQDCSVSEEDFKHMIERATGKDADPIEIQRVFSVFDHNHDGRLDYSDCIQFICAQNAVL
jgi:hypothetical protein